MQQVLTLILGGGAGTRLYPLTRDRAKPAVPLAGKYRLIDVAVSNCINSDMKRIYVMTQYLSASLNRHISQSYTFDQFSHGFVEILAAEQRNEDSTWFQGTADAVRKHWATLENHDCDLILILPGDALYRMDYRLMVEEHRRSGAELTVAVNTVEQARAHHFGVLGIDDMGAITAFREKPKSREEQAGFEAPSSVLSRFGVRRDAGPQFLASMGIYLFDRKVLDYWMAQTDHLDFGKQIIPESIGKFRSQSFLFHDYWEDIGTIAAFFKAHMDLLSEQPPFAFASPTQPIYTRARMLPSTRIHGAAITRCIVEEGCDISDCKLTQVTVGVRSRIGAGSTLEDCIVMGADHYEVGKPPKDKPPLGIGTNCHLRRTIVDKNVRMGNNVRILNEGNLQTADGPFYAIRDGIVIIPKNAVVPDGSMV